MNNHGRAQTDYGRGYLEGHYGRDKVPPANLTETERSRWLQGYEDGLRASIDSRRRPGGRPSLTR